MIVSRVFSTRFPAFSFGWRLEAESPATPLRGTLEFTGNAADYTVGSRVTVDGVPYVITNIGKTTAGTTKRVTLTVRDLLYDLYKTTALKNMSWVTCPDYFARQEVLNAIATPQITDLRVRKGDIFGVGGWRAKDIVEEAATIAGLSVSYQIPNFWVKQAYLPYDQPIFDFLKSFLGALTPRMFVSGTTLFIVPMKTKTRVGYSASVCESLSESTTYAERYKRFRITGGIGLFQKDKWEGKTLLTENTTTETVSLGDGTSVYLRLPCGYRRYYQTSTTTTTASKSMTVYAKDVFNNNAYVVFRQEWRFIRKKPLSLETADNVLNKAELYWSTLGNLGTYEETDPIPWPSPTDFWLDQCERTTYVHTAVGTDWEAPLLVEEHHTIWKYLWWSAVAASGAYVSNPPTSSAHDPDFGGAWPPGFATQLDQPNQPEYALLTTLRGVWSSKALIESTFYTYRSALLVEGSGDSTANAETVEKVYKYAGGLLFSKRSVARGVCAPVIPNLKYGSASATTGTYYNRLEGSADYRIQPAYKRGPGDINPGIGMLDDAEEGYHLIRETVEHYREVSMYAVVRDRATVEMSEDWYTWFDDKQQLATGKKAISNYRADISSDIIPWDEAPQTVVRKRGMTLWTHKTGDGTRVIEANCPYVVDWSDLNAVASHIWATHPDQKDIRTTEVVVPGRYVVHPAVFGGSITLSSASLVGRIVGMYYDAKGSGEHSTVFMVQEEI